MHYSVCDLQSISGCLYGIAMDIIEVQPGTEEHAQYNNSIKSTESSENVNSLQFDLEYSR